MKNNVVRTIWYLIYDKSKWRIIWETDSNKEMKKNSIYNFKSINQKNNMIFKAFTWSHLVLNFEVKKNHFFYILAT